MKKLEKIIEKGTFAENPAFQMLLIEYQSARENLNSAKEIFHQKRDEFSEKNEAKDPDEAEVFHLLAAAQIAKFQRSIRRVEVSQAKFELKNWLRQNQVDEQKAADEKPKKKEKTADEKQEKKKKHSDEATAESPKSSKKSKEKPTAADDLKIIEGIGPAIEKILQAADINTFEKLAKAEPQELREILQAAGSRYKMHDTTTWSEQARLAARGEMSSLLAWQQQLKAGKSKK